MKVLISTSSFGDCSPAPVELLKGHFEIVQNPYKRKLTEEEVVVLAKDCEGILAGLEPLNKRVIDQLPKLKCISRVGSGMDNVDITYAKKKNIKVMSTPTAPGRAVAELAVAFTFDLLRKVSLADRTLRDGIWKKQFGNLLLHKRVGIFGLGKIGKISAALFKQLGNEVSAHDLEPDQEWAEAQGIKLSDKETLLKESDVVVLHVSMGGSNKYIIGESELAMMKRGSFLINVARGKAVEEEALYRALKNGPLGGAAFDVFANEPYNGNLKELDNMILTPHIGSYTIETRIEMETEAGQNLINSIGKSGFEK